MKKEKIKNLQKKGWKVGSASDFLNLSRDEEEYIEMKLALSNYFQELSKEETLDTDAGCRKNKVESVACGQNRAS